MKKRHIILSAVILLLVAVLMAVIALVLVPSKNQMKEAALPEPSPEVWGSMAEITEEPTPTAPPAFSLVEAEPTPEASADSLLEDAPEPTTPETLTEPALAAMLEAELMTCSGKWSLYYENVDTGAVITIGNEPMVAASLIKFFVAGAYCQAVEQGKMADDYRSDLESMLSVSSNEACNRIIDALGMEPINQFISDFGADHTQLNRKMLQPGTENYTSPSDCGSVLKALLEGSFVSPEVSEELLSYLKIQERTHKIPAGVPIGVETANKTGELSDVENDAAIVWSEGGTYILCIMSDDVSAGTAQRNIVGISKLVYEYLNP